MSDLQEQLPQLKPFSLLISDIKYECYTWEVQIEGTSFTPYGGLIAFEGSFGNKHDEEFVRRRVNEFYEIFDYPVSKEMAGLIIDFRKLHYEWGTEMYELTHSFEPFGRMEPQYVPFRIVINPEEVNPKMYKAYEWALPMEHTRTNLKETYEEIHGLIIENWKGYKNPWENR